MTRKDDNPKNSLPEDSMNIKIEYDPDQGNTSKDEPVRELIPEEERALDDFFEGKVEDDASKASFAPALADSRGINLEEFFVLEGPGGIDQSVQVDEAPVEEEFNLDFEMFRFAAGYDQPKLVKEAIHIAAKYFLQGQIKLMLEKTDKAMPTFSKAYDKPFDVVKRDYFTITMFYSYIMENLSDYKMQIQMKQKELSAKNLKRLKKRSSEIKRFFNETLEAGLVPEELVQLVLENCYDYFNHNFLPMEYAESVAKGYDKRAFSPKARENLYFLVKKSRLSRELDRLKNIKDELDAHKDPVLAHLKEDFASAVKEGSEDGYDYDCEPEKEMVEGKYDDALNRKNLDKAIKEAESVGLQNRIDRLNRRLFLLEHHPAELQMDNKGKLPYM